jgi:NAD-specific glutamate dehydrogenase
MLAREIAMTVATTQLVGDYGAATLPALIEATGRPLGDVAVALLDAGRAAGLDALRPALEARTRGTALHATYEAWLAATDGVVDLARGRLASDGLAAPMPDLAAATEAIASSRSADEVARDTAEAAALGRELGVQVATAVRRIRALGPAQRLAAEAAAAGRSLSSYAAHRQAVSRATRLGEVLDVLHRRAGTGRWDPLAIGALHRRIDAHLRRIAAAAPARAADRAALAPIRAAVDDALAETMPSLAAFVVLDDRLAAMR